MTGDERRSSIHSQPATEMNSHLLNCTITGERAKGRLFVLFMQSRETRSGACCVLLILKCFIMMIIPCVYSVV